MKVGFDISQTAYRGGVAIYTNNLAKNLVKIQGLEMVFFFSMLRQSYLGDLPGVRKFKFPPSLLNVLFNKLRLLKIEDFIGQVDIFHSSDWLQPPADAKKVTTYHDLIPLKFPEWSNHKIISVHKRRLELVQQEVDKVIAVSNSCKSDLLEVSKIPEKKIVVIYEGVDNSFTQFSEAEIKEFKTKWGLPDKYVLAVGGIGARKNLPRIKQASQGHHLVILGEITGITQSDVPLVFASSEGLMYMSLYEGFGLPILEAMACGVPVLTSNVSSMPEISKDAALLANPYDVSDMKGKLTLLLEDIELRRELIKRGLKRAKMFTWEKCAEQTCQIYKELYKG